MKRPLKIPLSQHLINAVVALFITFILAVPLGWIASNSIVHLFKSVQYGRYEFAPFELIFVSENRTNERFGGDFVLHPDLFMRNGERYSAEINNKRIEFISNGSGRSDEPCLATVNQKIFGCEEINYFAEPTTQKFVRLTGDLGITSMQARSLNAPYFQFDEWVNYVRHISYLLVPTALFLGIKLLSSALIQRHKLTNRQKWLLLFPWAAGLVCWTLLRVHIEIAFS